MAADEVLVRKVARAKGGRAARAVASAPVAEKQAKAAAHLQYGRPAVPLPVRARAQLWRVGGKAGSGRRGVGSRGQLACRDFGAAAQRLAARRGINERRPSTAHSGQYA